MLQHCKALIKDAFHGRVIDVRTWLIAVGELPGAIECSGHCQDAIGDCEYWCARRMDRCFRGWTGLPVRLRGFSDFRNRGELFWFSESNS